MKINNEPEPEINPPAKITDYRWYIRGYTRAIDDTYRLITLYIEDLMYHHKRLGMKECHKFFQCLREHRAKFRDAINNAGPKPIIRYNKEKEGPEVFDNAK